MKYYSIWLIPQKKDEHYLSKIIHSLAKEYHVYPFIPHVTLYSFQAEEINEGNFITVLDKLVKMTRSICLTVKRISHSELLPKTLFAEIKNNKYLHKLHREIKSEFSKYTDYDLKPHLSLLYKNSLPVQEKLSAIEKLKLRQKYWFDRLIIIKALKLIEIEKDILDWEIIYRKAFLNH